VFHDIFYVVLQSENTEIERYAQQGVAIFLIVVDTLVAVKIKEVAIGQRNSREVTEPWRRFYEESAASLHRCDGNQKVLFAEGMFSKRIRVTMGGDRDVIGELKANTGIGLIDEMRLLWEEVLVYLLNEGAIEPLESIVCFDGRVKYLV